MIINNDSLMALKEIEDNSIDAVITDPPYGYSFMGKDWDKAVPSVEIWQECLRVLKPGGWCMVMSAPRSDVQNAMISRLMEAGFRLDFTPTYWTYASGFPKAGNVSKLVDKRLGVQGEVIGEKRFGTTSTGQGSGWNDNAVAATGRQDVRAAASDQAKALDGSYTGFQPKPAVEVIIVAMKPLSEKTYVDQALKNGKGITWLDDCRVPTGPNDSIPAVPQPMTNSPTGEIYGFKTGEGRNGETYDPTKGRFPANLLVSDDVLNDGVERKSGGGNKAAKHHNWTNKPQTPNFTGNDSGSYSRYFDLDKWAAAHLSEQQMKTFPFAIFPKASKSEKNKGLEHMEAKPTASSEFRPNHTEKAARGETGNPYGRWKPERNNHPTVKPLKLMSYLITLTTREGDTVLDPFVGSGTTVVAANSLSRKGIGIEREEEYAEIARARVEANRPEPKLALEGE